MFCLAINDFEVDETSTIGILYGVGGSFCAGYDLSEAAKGGANAVITRTDGNFTFSLEFSSFIDFSHSHISNQERWVPPGQSQKSL